MQEENRGPAGLRLIVGRHVDLIVIGAAADGDVAVEKSCLHLLQRSGNPKQQEKHGSPPEIKTPWRPSDIGRAGFNIRSPPLMSMAQPESCTPHTDRSTSLISPSVARARTASRMGSMSGALGWRAASSRAARVCFTFFGSRRSRSALRRCFWAFARLE